MKQSNYVMPSNGKDLKKIKAAIIEASDSQLQIESHRDQIANIKHTMKEDFGLPPKLFSRLVRSYHKQTYGEEVKEAEEFQDLYSGIFESENI